MKYLYYFILFLLIIVDCTSCQSHGLGKTCEKFGMETQYVDVVALDHDIDGRGFTQLKFHCTPKTKLKSERN